MTYLLAHLPDRPGGRWQDADPHEEIYVIAFGTRVAAAVPIGALRHLLPILEEAMAGSPAACCPGCGKGLPATAGTDTAP